MSKKIAFCNFSLFDIKRSYKPCTVPCGRKEEVSIVCTEGYKEHIVYTFNGFCKVVIRYADINAWRKQSRWRQREISFAQKKNFTHLVHQMNTSQTPAMTIRKVSSVGIPYGSSIYLCSTFSFFSRKYFYFHPFICICKYCKKCNHNYVTK